MTRTCSVCGTKGLTGECPICAEAWEHRQPADEMTPEERLEAFDAIPEKLEIDFSKYHKRIEELVGRPVWTHEMGTKGTELLRYEIISGNQPTFEGILAKIPPDKQVFVVEVEEPKD